MLAAVVITALAIMYLSKCAKCGRMGREVDYLKEENESLRDALFGRKVTVDDYYHNDVKWYEIK